MSCFDNIRLPQIKTLLGLQSDEFQTKSLSCHQEMYALIDGILVLYQEMDNLNSKIHTPDFSGEIDAYQYGAYGKRLETSHGHSVESVEVNMKFHRGILQSIEIGERK